MSTSVVFTHPGYENKTRMLISVEFVSFGHFGLWNSSTLQEMHLQMYVKSFRFYVMACQLLLN